MNNFDRLSIKTRLMEGLSIKTNSESSCSSFQFFVISETSDHTLQNVTLYRVFSLFLEYVIMRGTSESVITQSYSTVVCHKDLCPVNE